jgi:hypothetical protein
MSLGSWGFRSRERPSVHERRIHPPGGPRTSSHARWFRPLPRDVRVVISSTVLAGCMLRVVAAGSHVWEAMEVSSWGAAQGWSVPPTPRRPPDGFPIPG